MADALTTFIDSLKYPIFPAELCEVPTQYDTQQLGEFCREVSLNHECVKQAYSLFTPPPSVRFSAK